MEDRPTQIDAYVIERELPPGGMSRLFLATERSLDRQVVIKLLPPEYASEVSAVRFQREVTLTAHLQHPHILPILSAGSRDGLLYYVMPYAVLRHALCGWRVSPAAAGAGRSKTARGNRRRRSGLSRSRMRPV